VNRYVGFHIKGPILKVMAEKNKLSKQFGHKNYMSTHSSIILTRQAM
jgi:hypothetical protein